MKAAVLRGVNDLRLEEWPAPAIGAGELLLRLRACGLCGTDIHKATHQSVPVPAVLGHEVSGEVVEVGAGVTQFGPGDRVALSHHTPCFSCHYCRRGHYTMCPTWRAGNLDPGGFAEYIRVPAPQTQHNVYRIPEGMSFETASFLEPLACIVHACRRAAPDPGDTVLVIGAGAAGILQLQMARRAMAETVIVADVSAFRLEQARRFGASHVVDSAGQDLVREVRGLTGGRGVDYVFLAAPVPRLVSQAVDLLDRGGTVVVYALVGGSGVPVDARRIVEDELDVVGAYSSGPPDLEQAFHLLASGAIRVDGMVTHRLGLGQVGEAIALTQDPGARVMKVLILPE